MLMINMLKKKSQTYIKYIELSLFKNFSKILAAIL